MHKLKLRLKFIVVFTISGLFFTGCTDSNSDNLAQAITEKETLTLIESIDISDEIDNLVDNFLIELFDENNENETSKISVQHKYGMPNCIVKSIIEDESTKTITLDFGEGCELGNAYILSGKIIISYNEDNDLKITKTYDGFSFNDVQVDGTNMIIRKSENENGNPESTKSINVTYNWPDGDFITKVGIKKREWIEGYETNSWGDNVYLITGNWVSTFKDGNAISLDITKALRREMACRFIVSGIIEINKSNISGIIDFGDGTCDNLANYTDNTGFETEIKLRKNKHN